MPRPPQPGAFSRGGRLFALWLGLLLGFALPSVEAYVLSGQRWASNQPIVMHLGLGNPDQTLIDGSTSWNQVAEAALAVWNPHLSGGVQFQAADAMPDPVARDGINSVFFSQTIYGEDFGDDTVAITLSSYNAATHVQGEADVLVNTAKTFDSYRGILRYDNRGKVIDDLRRVLIHEFGHALGLEHTLQGSLSIMAPFISDIDTVQADDIAGVQAIYGESVVTPVITSSLAADGAVGSDFRYRITATGQPTRFQASGLPAGLSIDPASGLISGVPAAAGTYDVTLAATNNAGTGTAVLILTFGATPRITSPPTATAVYGRPFVYQIAANNQPTSFAVNYLPSGLDLDQVNGIISGTLGQPGSLEIVIEALNPVGTASDVLYLTVVLDANVTTVESFGLNASSSPSAALLQADDGSFYGTTNYGGVFNAGSIFRLTGGVLKTLYNFDKVFSDSDLALPMTLIQAADGSFYDVTRNGGAYDGGAVFKLTPDGAVATLHSFDAALEGFSPTGSLVQAWDGDFYGSTSRGGTLGAGSFFRLTPDGALTILGAQGGVEGNDPSTLIQAADGDLYGTMRSGGASGGGTVFRLTPAGVVTVLHAFTPAEGATPTGALVQGQDGLFYGALASGGLNNAGTIYKMTPAGAVTVLYQLGPNEGSVPSRMVQGRDGNFYGTTLSGGYVNGQGGNGTVFEVTPDGAFTTLHLFSAGDGREPSPLIQAADGEFYGVTRYAGENDTTGTIFRTTFHDPAASLLTVTPMATTPQVVAGSGESGVFTLTLSAPQATDTFVNYTVKGSAVNGTDYAFLKGRAKIKAGKISKEIKVHPQGDLGGAAKKVVTLTLAPGDSYTVGNTGKVKVKIVAAP